MAVALTDSGNLIERRYGTAAAAEWQVLLNRLELGEGFALVVLVVPDMDGARLCQGELESWLARRGRRLTVIAPESPAALHDAAVTLFGLPEDPHRGAIWLAAVPGPSGEDAESWDLAWRHTLVGLNQQRNPLRRRFLLPLILVGAANLVPAMREIAADLWSVRSLSLRIERELEATAGEREHTPALPDLPPRDGAPDPELALRMAGRVRGRDGQQRVLASLLARAGEGFAALGKWHEAEAAWHEAADLFGAYGPPASLGQAQEKLGDIAWLTGRTATARDAYTTALAIRETLARAEPDRADYQRDLSVSYNKMGDLYCSLGQGEAARDAYANALAIRETLAGAEPGRADYQRDLSVSYEKMGDLYRALGQGEAARDAYAKTLAIAETLARAEPDRADYQRDLSVSHSNMGDLYRALGQGEAARDAYAKALAIAETLARAEPDRAAYQRDLSVTYERMGDLYRALGQGEAARDAYAKALAIAETLARTEPDRADYQRDPAVSLVRHAVSVEGEAARAALQRALSILETLQSSGRLMPTDEPLLKTLRQMINTTADRACEGSASRRDPLALTGATSHVR
jgi:tetratricopeptide (TPR) repeat protein